jgi:hypothetical protein
MVDAGKPQRRLADTRFALKDEYCEPGPGLVEERADGGELCIPADDPERVRAAQLYVTTIMPCIHGRNPHKERSQMPPPDW